MTQEEKDFFRDILLKHQKKNFVTLTANEFDTICDALDEYAEHYHRERMNPIGNEIICDTCQYLHTNSTKEPCVSCSIISTHETSNYKPIEP